MRLTLFQWFAIVFNVLALIVIAALVISNLPVSEAVGPTVEARQAPEVRKELTIPLDVEFVKVFEPEVKAKLDLPKTVQQDKKKHVVAASKVKADDHPHTLITVLDEDTGEFSTYDRKDPLPWVAVANRTHIAAYYGLKDGQEVVRIQAQQELLQIKVLRLEAIAVVDIGAGKPDSYVGIGGRISF